MDSRPGGPETGPEAQSSLAMALSLYSDRSVLSVCSVCYVCSWLVSILSFLSPIVNLGQKLGVNVIELVSIWVNIKAFGPNSGKTTSGELSGVNGRRVFNTIG